MNVRRDLQGTAGSAPPEVPGHVSPRSRLPGRKAPPLWHSGHVGELGKGQRDFLSLGTLLKGALVLPEFPHKLPADHTKVHKLAQGRTPGSDEHPEQQASPSAPQVEASEQAGGVTSSLPGLFRAG